MVATASSAASSKVCDVASLVRATVIGDFLWQPYFDEIVKHSSDDFEEIVWKYTKTE